MDAREIWERAVSAARALKDVEGAAVGLGTRFSVEDLRMLAAVAGVKPVATVYRDETGPYVLEWFGVMVEGVEVRAQARREATQADRDLRGHVSGACRSLERAAELIGGAG